MSTDFNPTFSSEVDDVVRKLMDLKDTFSTRQRRGVLRRGAKPLVEAARAAAPVSDGPHYRYSTAKASGKLRAPNGSGRKVATYNPGNLRAAIGILTFRRSQALFVGPNVAKGLGNGSSGEFGPGGKVDAYYAHWVEFGTVRSAAKPYMRPAWDATKETVEKKIVSEFQKLIQRYERKHTKL